MRALAALVVLAPALAHADASETAADAERLAKAGAFTEAAGRFREAYRLDPQPKYLCNVGIAYQKAKQLAKAHLYLGECLRTGVSLDAAFLAKVGGVVATLEDSLRAAGFVAVEIAVTPETATLELETFERDEKFVGSRTLWMTTGRHTVTVSADGFTSQSQDIVASATTGRVAIDLAAISGPLEERRVPAGPPPAPRGRGTLPYIVALGAAVLAGGAIGFEIAGRSKLDAAEAATDEGELMARYDEANQRHYAAQALSAGALVGAGVAVYLFLRPRGEAPVVVAPTASATSATLVLTTSF